MDINLKAAFDQGVVTTDHGLEWRRPWSQNDPYGMVRWCDANGAPKLIRAHRAAWVLAHNHIPQGYEVDHLPSCPKTCVTVAHLQLLTRSEHAKLGWERGELNGGWGTKRERIHPPRAEAFIWQTERQCKRCDVVFIPTTAQKIFCSSICMVEDKEERRARVRYPRPNFKFCSWCDQEFEPKRIDSTFCSRTCMDSSKNFEKSQIKLAERGGEETLFAEMPCVGCDEMFSPTNRTMAGRQKFCSTKCGTTFRDRERKLKKQEVNTLELPQS